MTTIGVQLPQQLERGVRELVSQGWFTDEAELIREAIRRYLDSHENDVVDRFFKEDIEWGLNGNE